MKIILLNPPLFKDTESIAPDYMNKNSAFNYPPLGLLYLASNLKGDHECKIIDSIALGYSINDCLEAIKKYKPSIVGITVFTDSLYSCFSLSTKIKNFDSRIKIVFGGPHINIYPEETIRFSPADYILTGFAENSFANLVETIYEKQGNTNMRFEDVPGLWWKNGRNIFKSDSNVDKFWDINKIKRPNRNLLDIEKYFTVANPEKITTMISSRGCPFSCTFCDVFEKRYLKRNIDDIVNELKEIIGLGIKQVHFFDDCFNLKRERVVKMCHAFIDNNLKFEWSFRGRLEPSDKELAQLLYKAGCRRVQFGVEATDQKTINIITKKIDISKVSEILKIYSKNNIGTMGYFILGFPEQTYEDCIASCKKILKMGFNYINMFILIPYPNTEIYKDLLDRKIIKKDYWHEYAINPQPDFKLERWHSVEREKLEKLINKYYKKFYFSLRFIFFELKKKQSMFGYIKKINLIMGMVRNKF